jgi:4'-phosphopantetheinyl transferase
VTESEPRPRWATGAGVAGPPPADAVHVWWLSLATSPGSLEDGSALLEPHERERAARFVYTRDRDRFVAGRVRLRRLLSRYVDTLPERLRFQEGSHGKPAVRGRPDCHFNFSRSGARGLCAVTGAGPVGVDLETLRPLPDAASIAERHFAAKEQETLHALPSAERELGFFRAWTRKEALIKATGEGLTRRLTGFEVSLDADARLLRIEDDDATCWTLRSFAPERGFVAALALRARPPRIDYFVEAADA